MGEGEDSSQRSRDTTWEEALEGGPGPDSVGPIPGQETSSHQTPGTRSICLWSY